MRLQLNAPAAASSNPVVLQITGSKSESNRLLILQQQFPQLQVENLSNSDDTIHLKQALDNTGRILDIGHAGTAMRFLTAFLSNQPGQEVILTGSDRMKQRPIGILVDALRSIGASIAYTGQEGYPPLKIHGKKLKGGQITIDAGVSSQYLSALLLIGSQLEKGLELQLAGKLTSRPYLEMTTQLLTDIGVAVDFKESSIHVKPTQAIPATMLTVESDWSSAGYWYSWCALQKPGYTIQLSAYKKNSLQGDSKLAQLYTAMGVTTSYQDHTITLCKNSLSELQSPLEFDLTEQPDQAQTIFATCIGLGIDLRMTGLHTLRIKETDRIEAMRVEGARFRESEIQTTPDTIEIIFPNHSAFNKQVAIDTYNDHRMALAFAPLCMKTQLTINDAEVVTKSYGDYWNDLKAVKVDITEI